MAEPIGPRYVSPYQMEYREHFDHILTFNRSLQRRFSKEVCAAVGPVPDVCVATTGSDARLEKGPVSPLEIIAFVQGVADIKEPLAHLQTYAGKIGSITLVDEDVEVRHLENNEPLSYFTATGNEGQAYRKVSPSRIIDARFLCGSKAVLYHAKHMLANELRSPDGRDVFEGVKKLVAERCKVTETGTVRYKGNDVVQFDMEKEIAYYMPKEGQLGFKGGPLRAVQFALTRDMVKGVRAGAPLQSLLETPHNTVEKINHLSVERKIAISPEGASELGDHYKFFLWMYHQQQANFFQEGITTTPFERSEVQARASAIAAMCREPILKLI